MDHYRCECNESRASEDWCTECKRDYSMEWESLKLQEQQEADEHEFEVKSAQGCI